MCQICELVTVRVVESQLEHLEEPSEADRDTREPFFSRLLRTIGTWSGEIYCR